MSEGPFPESWRSQWVWQGRRVAYVACRAGEAAENSNGAPRPAVVLVHGFGACKEHWRHNVAALAAAHDVYALDLIGFGESDKPPSRLAGEPATTGDCPYGVELWALQVVAFLEEVVRAPVTLVGNSIGGVVVLRSAALLEEAGRPATQVLLVDCAQRALDDKRLAEQPPLRRYGRPLLKSLVRQRWLTRWLFDRLRSAGVIRRVLGVAYPSGANLDDQLVELLLAPTRDPGAAEAFRGFINLFHDHLAPDLLEQLHTPVRIVWGEADPWEPVAEARRWQGFACVRSLQVLPGLGHCPHDEAPEQVNPWLLEALAQEAGA
ncbi:MAG: alpha/beta fold hydrolase [Synechococcus sp.]|nr:alpha/beta fold hydrolase [Synechococcus sp.]